MITSDRERQAPTTIEDAEPTHLARYLFAKNYIIPGDTVLDAPCGSGYGTKVLSQQGAHVVGIDIHKGAIDHAKEFFLNDLNSFYCGDIENLETLIPYNTSLEVIVSFEGIEHLRNPKLFLSEVHRLLKPTGTLIISTPRKPHGSPFHITEYSLNEFEALLSDTFVVKEMFGQIYDKFHDLSKESIDPSMYTKFNFIAICSPK